MLEEAENNLLQTDLLFLNIYNSIAKYYDFIGEQKKSEKYFLKSNIFITQNKLNSTLLTRNLFDLAMLYLNDEERRSDGLNIYRKVKNYINFETSNYNHSIYIAKGIEALIALKEDKIKESIQKQLDQIDYTKKYLGENSMYLAEPYGILGVTYGIFFEN